MSSENLKITICCRRSSIPAAAIADELYQFLRQRGHRHEDILLQYLPGSLPGGDNPLNPHAACDGMTESERALIQFVPEEEEQKDE